MRITSALSRNHKIEILSQKRAKTMTFSYTIWMAPWKAVVHVTLRFLEPKRSRVSRVTCKNTFHLITFVQHEFSFSWVFLVVILTRIIYGFGNWKISIQLGIQGKIDDFNDVAPKGIELFFSLLFSIDSRT